MAKRVNFDFELSFFEKLHKRIPKDVRVTSILAHIYTQTGQIDAGLRLDRKLVRLTPEDPTAHYNLACSLCLKNRYADAVRTLRDAITHGYDDFQWMQNDPDLHELQGYPDFCALLKDLKIG
ncbi:MAG: TPR end-of-group domain-containing protein [Lentimonas sp.]